MSEHYFQVGVHGPPDPDEHPWVASRNPGLCDDFIVTKNEDEDEWADRAEWFPVDAPPSELAPEPEGVEVDGWRYRINADGYMEKHTRQFGWVLSEYREVLADDLPHLARVAQALGLVDQPNVPKALVEWLRESGYRHLLRRIEAGEFGPVAPSVEDDEFLTLIVHGPHDDPHPMGDLNCPQCGAESAPSVQWVTDRLPEDAEFPVLVNDAGHFMCLAQPGKVTLVESDRWVSLSVLLDAAGLEER